MRQIDRDRKKTSKFEYETLPSAQRASVRALTLEIRGNLKTTVETIWQVGKNLFEVRQQIDIRQFNLWLKAEFDWSRRTAYVRFRSTKYRARALVVKFTFALGRCDRSRSKVLTSHFVIDSLFLVSFF